ncbi:murein hydrolase activator EnvC family protein [Streptomyces nodosus]|uniref:murein hydrolase activator EnvC family protein n=1 Tax=Streptomyces nodosus TaxID=40318 RepID=UPI0036EED79C
MRAKLRAKRRWRAWPVVPLMLTAGVPAPVARAGPPSGLRADAAQVAEPLPGSEAPVPAVARTWPVGVRPEVVRGWDPPAHPYGPGHRGVDLAAAEGDPVRSVAAGRVAFAGRVAGRGVVSVDLAGTGEPPLRTTYEPVRASVHTGDEVGPGTVLGVLEPPTGHCAGPCVHWGLRRGKAYLNPLSLLRTGPSRLLPVDGVPLP